MTSPIIQLNHLEKTFLTYKKKPGLKGSLESLFARKVEKKKAVIDLSFAIESGEIVGFIGQNGAGKTTTLKMLSGLLFPTSGSARVLGYNPWDRQREFQKQFALVMGQKNQLWWDLPPMETYLLNQAIYDIPESSFRHTLKKLTDLLDVSDVIEIQTRKLSLGQRMKCELIAALLHNPKVLFLDEPTIGLDVVMQKIVRDFIIEYNKEYGATIILTSHYMDDVKELCPRAIVIDRGSLLFDGELQGLINTFARDKILSFVFSKPVGKRQLGQFGQVKELTEDGSNLTATIAVPRSQATQIASQALAKLPIIDVTIEEVPIETIIREVFSHQNSA